MSSRIAIFEGYQSPFRASPYAQYGAPYGSFGIHCNKGCVPDPSLPVKKVRKKVKLSMSRKAVRARKTLGKCAKKCSKRRGGKFQPCMKKCFRSKR